MSDCILSGYLRGHICLIERGMVDDKTPSRRRRFDSSQPAPISINIYVSIQRIGKLGREWGRVYRGVGLPLHRMV